MKHTCILCGEQANLVVSKHPGYKEGTAFDIYECPYCDTAFSDPLITDDLVYNTLYRHKDAVPGYERYGRYASLVTTVKDPLKALADSEPIYWSAIHALTENVSDPHARVLEVGTGLGYFVYGLRLAGYQARGIDISEDAVKEAVARFGNFYTIGSLKIENGKGYDSVVMLETIEHVLDPEELLREALAALRPGGVVIVTTPNKSRFSGPPWSMDPPVHPWSFSEKSLQFMANRLSVDVKFVDFTPYTKKFFTYTTHVVNEPNQSEAPYRLQSDGSLHPHFRVNPWKGRLFGVRFRHWLSVSLRRCKKKDISDSIPTICAVFTKSRTEV